MNEFRFMALLPSREVDAYSLRRTTILCGENAYQTFVQLQNAIRVDMLLQGDRFVQRLFRQTQVACKTAQYLVAEEIVGMIFDQPCVGLCSNHCAAAR